LPHQPEKASEQQVISLHLEHLSELFALPGTDLLSPGRTNYYLTGMEVALGELRGHSGRRRPVCLEISVPAAEAAADGAQTVAGAIQRYCDARIRYNRLGHRAAMLHGARALRVGLLVVAAGIILTTFFRTVVLATVIGAVLIWVGLWYPLDQLLFYAGEWLRENKPLRRLRDAEVVLRARAAAEPGGLPVRLHETAGGVPGPHSER
jgi:hypothetical protein